MGRTSSAVLLDVFAPMGPERVYRDPKDEAGRAAFEVIRDAPPAAPAGAKFTVGATAGADVLPVFGGKGKIKPLLEPAKTGQQALYVGILEAEPGAEVPRNTPPGIGGDPVRRLGRRRASPSAARRSRSGPRRRCTSRTASRTRRNSPARTRRSCYRCSRPAGPEERYRAAPAGRRASPQDQVTRPMIDFELSEDQRVLQASVREMCERLHHSRTRAAGTRKSASRTRSCRRWARWACSGCRSPEALRRRRDEVPRLRDRAGRGRPRRRVASG